jgi:RimJ/RimL family protein N-acetyltransferase
MSETSPWRPEVIPGERIFLSHISRDDVELYGRWFADLELTTYLGATGMSYTIEQERDWVERTLKETDTKTFAIIVRTGQQVIGSVSLMNIDHRNNSAILGIAIGDKSAWSQGYGSEAVRLICDYGFTFLNLYNIHLAYFAFNERGRRSYLKAGFQEVGRIRGARLLNGKRYDEVLMDITRDDFGPSQLIGLISQIKE